MILFLDIPLLGHWRSGVKPGEVKEDSFASAKAEEWNKLFSK
ncbi:hypothetical protein KIS1582_3636 [Cytobacillus firmus]|uniref:Uncharacterized protein n=1 Tax=Cytobacillus firmus TaxID=1399 RepID=A0A800N9C6_CYTFI|nr:hypothetical protein KIS1582_3636 [Cytobacillus firmus]